jgi:hypothetical protein
MSYKLAFALFSCIILGLSFSAFADELKFYEPFDKLLTPEVSLVKGVKGQAGRFDGKGSMYLRVGKKSEWVSLELYFNAEEAETSGTAVPDWLPLVHPEGNWNPGDFQLILREGKASAHIHNGGTERIKLYSEKIKNNTWYKLKLVMDAKEHKATLYLDDKQADSAALNPEIPYFAFRSLSLGNGNHKKLKGMLDEVSVTLKPFQDVQTDDPRNIANGIKITHNELYVDQPLIVVTPKGTWVCCQTVAPGGEGSRGQHIVAVRSTDGGKTWGSVIDIETGKDGGGYVTPLITPSGRIYAFYCPPHSKDKPPATEEIQNYFCYKYSDDEGLTWSKRYWLPIRSTAWNLQREAVKSKIGLWCWCIAKPVIEGNDVFFPFAITGGVDGNGAGWIAHSDNILTENEPEKIHWEILPEGTEGIRNPDFTSTQEEHCLLPLNQKDAFVCVYRTRLGFPAISYSNDRCRTWSLPQKMTYINGRVISHPRACPMIWKCQNGKYLFWQHNNSHKSFENRNPVWVSGGIERNGKIYWSQPDILLYADDAAMRMSYPDLIEYKGEYWISETEKELPRIHKIDNRFLDDIWKRVENDLDRKITPISQQGLVLETAAPKAAFPKTAAALTKTGGLTLDFELNSKGLEKGTILLDNRSATGNGIAVVVDSDNSLRFEVSGIDNRGRQENISWKSDPLPLKNEKQRISIVIDNNARIVIFFTDGQINDGNHLRDLGWGRFWLAPKDISGTGEIKIHPSVKNLRIYNRYLHAFEM